MEISIVYFSGTGNTARIAEEIAKRLEGFGHEVEAKPVEKVDPESLKGKAIGLGFPSYGLCYPSILEPFLQSLPRAKEPVPAFVFSTHAWASGDSLVCAAEKLLEKNIMAVARESFKAPSNGAATFFHKEHIMYRKMVKFEPGLRRKLDSFAAKVDEAFKRFQEKPFVDIGKKKWYNEILGFFARHVMERRLYRDFKVDKKRCIGCGRCVNQCPDDNLVMKDGKAEFIRGNDCLRCMRCISICPVDAILFGERTRDKERYKAKLRDKLLKEALSRGHEVSGQCERRYTGRLRTPGALPEEDASHEHDGVDQ